jgi:Secretion system C-terminal sorting domain
MIRNILVLLGFLCALALKAQTINYYLPSNIGYVRGMVVGGNTYNNAQWKAFADKHGFGICNDLTEMAAVATASKHPEIAFSNYILTGNSAGAQVKVIEAIANPSRVIAVHASHGGMLARGNDGFNVNRNNTSTDRTNTLALDSILRIPILFTYCNADGFVSPVIMQGFSAYGRRFAAPWNFVIDSTDTHTDYSISFPQTIAPWLDGVVNKRVPKVIDTTKLSYKLLPILDTIGWLGDIYTKKIAKYHNFTAKIDSANWFPDSLSAVKWRNFAMVPTYKIPPQPIVAPSGIIANLTVYDPVNNDISTGNYWRINANFKESDQLLTPLKFFAVAPIPPSIQGTNWIRSMAVGANVSDFTVDPIFSFKVTADATVYVALSDVVTPLPTWLSTWQNTNEDLMVCSGNLKSFQKYSLYAKRFAKNSVATMGSHGTNNTVMYMTFVKPDNATTSIEALEKSRFSIFPNPASTEINISTQAGASFSTEIINVLGAVVLKNQNETRLDISGLQKGIYFLRMKIGTEIYVQKFVKQ